MKKAGGAILMLGLVLAFLLRGSFVQQIFTMLAAFYVLPAAVLFVVVWALSSVLRKHGLPSNFRTVVFFVLVISGTTGLSFYLGKFLNGRDLKSARNFVEAVVPKLDAFKNSHESYPEEISELNYSRKMPRILSYSRDQDNPNAFSFYYSDPAGMLDGYGYLSSDREWFYAD